MLIPQDDQPVIQIALMLVLRQRQRRRERVPDLPPIPLQPAQLRVVARVLARRVGHLDVLAAVALKLAEEDVPDGLALGLVELVV